MVLEPSWMPAWLGKKYLVLRSQTHALLLLEKNERGVTACRVTHAATPRKQFVFVFSHLPRTTVVPVTPRRTCCMVLSVSARESIIAESFCKRLPVITSVCKRPLPKKTGERTRWSVVSGFYPPLSASAMILFCSSRSWMTKRAETLPKHEPQPGSTAQQTVIIPKWINGSVLGPRAGFRTRFHGFTKSDEMHFQVIAAVQLQVPS